MANSEEGVEGLDPTLHMHRLMHVHAYAHADAGILALQILSLH